MMMIFLKLFEDCTAGLYLASHSLILNMLDMESGRRLDSRWLANPYILIAVTGHNPLSRIG